MQSQIVFVPSRPQLVSVAEFDDEPICLFAGIEIVIGAAFLPVKLGDSTLRFETAGIAAVAIAAASLALSRQSNG
jgi:hypothetical protein